MPHSGDPVGNVPIEDSDDEVMAHERGHSSRGQGSPGPRSRERFQATVKTWAAAISALAAVVMAAAAIMALETPQRESDTPVSPEVSVSPVLEGQGE